MEAKYTSEVLRLKNIYHFVQDIRNLEFEDNFFDRVFCICVIEHIEPENQEKAIKELVRVLKPGGILSLTFDYGNYWGSLDSSGTIKSPRDLFERIIKPSGLEVICNESLKTDVELFPLLPYESIEYIFGSLFMRKPGTEKRNLLNTTRVEKSLDDIASGRLFPALKSIDFKLRVEISLKKRI